MGGRPVPDDGFVDSEIVDYEIVTTAARTIRVYDRARGDFLLELPENARATFGYFNPAAAGEKRGNYDQFGGPGGQTMKTTALRIYEGKDQIAAFLGVDGFRDQSLKLTRLTQKVTIEHNFEDDGQGNTDLDRKVRKALTAASEDVPF